MSNNSNYIQTTENVQQPKKYYSYLYEIKHLPTGLFYVGSRSTPKVLKTYEDCFNDVKYMGSPSSSKNELFKKQNIKKNPNDYIKTVLKVFCDEDINKAFREEHGENGLIMTYWKKYGKDKVLNKSCFLNLNEIVFSSSGEKSICITNGIKNKHITIDKDIPEGWWRGETKSQKALENNLNANLKKAAERNGKYHTIWKDLEEKQILKEELDYWLSLGWKKGRKKSDNTNHNSKQKIQCPYCSLQTNVGNMKRHIKTHFEIKTPRIKKTKEEISKSLSNSLKGKKKTQYYCPYNANFISDGGAITSYIRSRYPNEKQWSEFTKEEKENYLVVSRDDTGLIVN